MKAWKWFVGPFAFVLAASVAQPFFVRAQRPPRQTFRVNETYVQSFENKRIFDDLTQRSFVVEGPCDGGCFGGVLRQKIPIEIQKRIPDLRRVNSKNTTFIWLYNLKPTVVARRNDVWGDDELTIHATPTSDQEVHFAAAPSPLVAPRLQWIFVETNE